MDVTKLLAVLEYESLYFCRLDRLQDQAEGMPTAPDRDDGALPDEVRIWLTGNWRKLLYVNCWHSSPVESAAMWKVFCNEHQGVAIRTTFSRIVESLERTETPVNVGRVTYVDRKTAITPNNLPFGLRHAVQKGSSFSFEQEVRLMVQMVDGPESGMFVRVNVSQLVDTIYVSPTAPSWLCDLVEKCARRFGLDVPVHQSQLYQLD